MLTKFPGNTEEWLKKAGCHSKETMPTLEDERLVFAVLEAIDFKCWDHGCAIPVPDCDTAKNWLVENKATVRTMVIPPPSYLGLLAGVFDFLLVDEVSNAN